MPNRKYPSIVKSLSRDQADVFVRNTVKMRGLKPDDPIDWDEFSTESDAKPKEKKSLRKRFGDGFDRLMMVGLDREMKGRTVK